MVMGERLERRWVVVVLVGVARVVGMAARHLVPSVVATEKRRTVRTSCSREHYSRLTHHRWWRRHRGTAGCLADDREGRRHHGRRHHLRRLVEGDVLLGRRSYDGVGAVSLGHLSFVGLGGVLLKSRHLLSSEVRS